MKPAISYYPLPRPIFGKCHSILISFAGLAERREVFRLTKQHHPAIAPVEHMVIPPVLDAS